jgi:epsin
MLSDVEKIRAERRKAKANRHKYTGTGNDGMGFGSGGRYGGFEGGSYGNSGGSYNGGGGSSYDRGENRICCISIWHDADASRSFVEFGGGYSGESSGGFRDETRRGGFEEYNAGDDEISTSRRSNSISQPTSGNSNSRRVAPAAVPAPPKPKEPEVDLLGGFGDEDVIASGADTNVFATEKALPALNSPPAFAAAPATAPADGAFAILRFAKFYHNKTIYVCDR